LGPILFCIYVDDVSDIIIGNTACKLFADDIKLYSCVETDGSSSDLDASLNNLISWATKWQLKVNLSKCNVMRIGRNSSLAVYDYNSDVIPRVNRVNDLGIVFSTNLDFTEYINSCISKAFSRSFLVFKGFSCRNSTVLSKAFVTYVRPLLEYNTYIWSPNDVGSITKLESVQRRFTKRIPAVAHMSYCDRLKALGLESLEFRRLRYDLVMMYKIVHNLVDLERDALITILPSSVTRNSLLKISKPTSLSSARCKFLCVRSINVWNFLSEETRAAPSISRFKNSLHSYDLSKFIKCC